MIVDSMLFDKYIRHLIRLGIAELQNTKLYYDIINDKEASKFIIEQDAAPYHFRFLYEILEKQDLTKCPICGHYNDNIECPIIRCSLCDHQWKISTPSAIEVCNECIAFKTDHCRGNKIKDGEIHRSKKRRTNGNNG